MTHQRYASHLPPSTFRVLGWFLGERNPPGSAKARRRERRQGRATQWQPAHSMVDAHTTKTEPTALAKSDPVAVCPDFGDFASYSYGKMHPTDVAVQVFLHFLRESAPKSLWPEERMKITRKRTHRVHHARSYEQKTNRNAGPTQTSGFPPVRMAFLWPQRLLR